MSNMPPIPPGNRSDKGPANPKDADKQVEPKDASGQSGKHHNSGEEGETGNIKQNTTNKGYYRGRRQG